MPAELITAVALYGTKTGHFKILLETVQAILSERLRDRFRPYALDQIHGTVIRLDGVADAQAGFVVNLRYLEVTGVPRAMDHARALEILAAHLTPPLSIRIGGYGRFAALYLHGGTCERLAILIGYPARYGEGRSIGSRRSSKLSRSSVSIMGLPPPSLRRLEQRLEASVGLD